MQGWHISLLAFPRSRVMCCYLFFGIYIFTWISTSPHSCFLFTRGVVNDLLFDRWTRCMLGLTRVLPNSALSNL